MTAQHVLAALKRAAVRVRLTDQGLAFAPGLDRRLRALVTAHKADLVRALDPEVAWRVAVLSRQLTGAAAVPLLVARPGTFAVKSCTSCGDALLEAPLLGSGRCRPCRAAASVVAARFLAQTPVCAAHATRIA